MKTHLMNILNEILSSIGKPKTGGSLNLEETQKDKISPHSSLEINELSIRLRRAFPPQAGYKVVGIANTNSMEPLFDDNSIIVEEDLTTAKWRKVFLERQPLVAGDIIVYDAGKYRIIHMLIKKTNKGWLIKGTNNKTPDLKLIKEEKILNRLAIIGYAKQKRSGD